MLFLDTERDTPEFIHSALTERPAASLVAIEVIVRDILAAVRAKGDDALVEFTRKFDSPGATLATLEEHIDFGAPQTTTAPLAQAVDNILTFHRAERSGIQSWAGDFSDGVRLGQRVSPVKRAGIYVPGGKAVYPSTVLMAAIPAIVAGVDEIIFCSPAGKDGQLSPVVLDAIRALPRTVPFRIFKLGGAVAIGAMAYGTATVPRVDVIVGPGNDYVNIAKRLVYGDVGIDMLAGPSDIAVIADYGAQPAYVAADILAQTEHGPENRAVLFSPLQSLLDQVKAEIELQSESLSRKAILDQSAGNLILVKTRDLAQAAALSDLVAPEHLELQVREPEALLPLIHNAGAILLGDYTSAPIGDYLAGPSHTLPTGGASRFSSPLSVTTFLKRTSILSYTRAAATHVAETVALFAEAEGFDAHASASRIRTA